MYALAGCPNLPCMLNQTAVSCYARCSDRCTNQAREGGDMCKTFLAYSTPTGNDSFSCIQFHLLRRRCLQLKTPYALLPRVCRNIGYETCDRQRWSCRYTVLDFYWYSAFTWDKGCQCCTFTQCGAGLDIGAALVD